MRALYVYSKEVKNAKKFMNAKGGVGRLPQKHCDRDRLPPQPRARPAHRAPALARGVPRIEAAAAAAAGTPRRQDHPLALDAFETRRRPAWAALRRVRRVQLGTGENEVLNTSGDTHARAEGVAGGCPTTGRRPCTCTSAMNRRAAHRARVRAGVGVGRHGSGCGVKSGCGEFGGGFGRRALLGAEERKWRRAPRKEKVWGEAVTACAEWMEESGEDQRERSAGEAAEVDADRRERGWAGASGMVSIISIASCSCGRGENADVEADQRECRRAEPGVMGAEAEADQCGRRAEGGGGGRQRHLVKCIIALFLIRARQLCLDLHLFELDLLPHTAILPLVPPYGTPARGNLNANWGGVESRAARLVLELEVEAVNTSQHEDDGKRREEFVRVSGRVFGVLLQGAKTRRKRGGRGFGRRAGTEGEGKEAGSGGAKEMKPLLAVPMLPSRLPTAAADVIPGGKTPTLAGGRRANRAAPAAAQYCARHGAIWRAACVVVGSYNARSSVHEEGGKAADG
ncbi:hypothetical protein B0H14DRAFT_2607362 [Mycena olivaceomarginata]|nr:hypothetical protein B0H14DRAFT_2607362 [Mycena olivaceomarginata]